MLVLLPPFYFFISLVLCGPGTEYGHTSKLQLQERTTNPPVNVWELSGQFQGDIKKSDGISARNVQRFGRWPNGIVPYTIDRYQFNQAGIANIKKAMRTIEAVLSKRGINDGSCQIKFVPRRKTDDNYVEIMSDGPLKCWSYMGMQGGKQQASLGEGCADDLGTIIHEFCHALGLAHQHEAHNRDQYVRIIWSNIETNMSYAFEKKTYEKYTDFGLPYDFKSIMHYSPYAFAKIVDGKYVGPTIVPLDSRIKLGINNDLSEIDMLKLELMYCGKHTSVKIG